MFAKIAYLLLVVAIIASFALNVDARHRKHGHGCQDSQGTIFDTAAKVGNQIFGGLGGLHGSKAC